MGKTRHLEAVVMAGGKGTRMGDLTRHNSKGLLPIANYPMVWHVLNNLEKSGFDRAYVLVPANKKADFYNQLCNKYNIKLELKIIGVPPSQDLGTADALRVLAKTQPDIKGDLVVMSCDTITDVPVSDIVEYHQEKNASITAMYVEYSKDKATVSVPGQRGKKTMEKEYIGLDESTSRIALIAPEDDLEEVLDFDNDLFRRHPNIQIISNLMDAHIYVISKYVFDYIVDRKNYTALKGDLLPDLVQEQFKEPPPSSEDNEEEEHFENPELVAEFYKEKKAPKMKTGNIYEYLPALDKAMVYATFGNISRDRIQCLGYFPKDSYLARANTIAGYIEANRELTKRWSALTFGEPNNLIHPSSKRNKTAQIGNDCSVGNGTEVGEKTMVIRSVVGQHCKIGNNVKITNSIVMDYVEIEDGVQVQGSIVCENATLEQRCEIKDCIVLYKHTVPKTNKHNTEIVGEKESFMV